MWKPDYMLKKKITNPVAHAPWFWIVILAVLGLAVNGCQYQRVQPMGMDNMPLEQARESFLQGDYNIARETFAALIKQTHSANTFNTASHGLNCVDMITATDTQAFLKALESLLHNHSQTGTVYPWNSELLLKALDHGSRLMTKEHQTTLNQLAGLKAKNKEQSMEIINLQQEIKTLQHQILSLENIDQELQEKRKNQ